MIRKIAKIIGLISLILSYTLLIWNIIQNGFPIEFTELFKFAWIFGAISLISNSVYAILIDLNQTLFSLFGFCGLIWLALPIVSESFGIASLLIFLIIGIYIHLQSNKRNEKTD